MARVVYEKSSQGNRKVSGKHSEKHGSGGDWARLGVVFFLILIAFAAWVLTCDHNQGHRWKQNTVDNLNLAMDVDETAVFKVHVTNALTTMRLEGYEQPQTVLFSEWGQIDNTGVYGMTTVTFPANTGLSYLEDWAQEAQTGNLHLRDTELVRMKTFLRGYEYPFNWTSGSGMFGCGTVMVMLMILAMACFMYGIHVSDRE